MHTPTVNRRGFSPHSLSTDYALLMSFYDIINTLCECIKLRISYSLHFLNAISMQKVCRYYHLCKESILCFIFYHFFDKKSIHKTNNFYKKTNILVLHFIIFSLPIYKAYKVCHRFHSSFQLQLNLFRSNASYIFLPLHPSVLLFLQFHLR